MAATERFAPTRNEPNQSEEQGARPGMRVPGDATTLIAAMRELIAGEVERKLSESDRPRVAPSASRLVTVEEAAGLLRCKPQRVYDLLSQRRLSRVKEGGRTLLLRDEVEGLPETTRRARATS